MSIDKISSLGNVITRATQSTASSSLDFSSILSSSMSDTETDLDEIFERAADEYGVPVSLLKAVAKAESNFDPDATSSCGAMGIMQLMPGTASSLGVSDAYDPEQNIMGGAKLLSQLLSQFNGDTELALAAYNAGPGNVIKYDGIPPFDETQSYVAKVMEYSGTDIDAGTLSEGISSGATPYSILSLQSAGASDTSQMILSLLQMQLDQTEDDANEYVI